MPRPRRYPNAAARQAAYRARQAAGTASVPSQAVPSLPLGSANYSRWRALLQQADALLKTALTEMEAYYDQRPERWQESDRGADFATRLETLQEAQALLTEVHG